MRIDTRPTVFLIILLLLQNTVVLPLSHLSPITRRHLQETLINSNHIIINRNARIPNSIIAKAQGHFPTKPNQNVSRIASLKTVDYRNPPPLRHFPLFYPHNIVTSVVVRKSFKARDVPVASFFLQNVSINFNLIL